jgi:sigma-B regulation protein RsbU (phosphoserine phosphatase)
LIAGFADKIIMKRRGFSLRYKLLAALTLIPMVGLSLFLMLAVNIFQKDKIAYIFDSSLSVSKTRAARVNSEINSMISVSQAVVLAYRSDTKNLSESGTYYFEREAKFEAFQVHAWNVETSSYEKTVDLSKPQAKNQLGPEQDKLIKSLVEHAHTSNVYIAVAPGGGTRIWLAARFGDVNDPKRVIALTLFQAAELEQVFADTGPFRSFLARKTGGEKVFGGDDPAFAQWPVADIWSELASKNAPEGIGEVKSPSARVYLASYAEAGIGDLVVVSLVDQKAALAAIDVLMKKSVLFFIAVLSMTAIIAVLAARGLTSALSRLSSATRKIAEGDFGVRVEVKAQDEIGLLGDSFNKMAEEVSRLMKETAEKARMESELATAKAVQETLFPESTAQLGTVQIAGHYQPASECGGDWWHYCENNDKVYIWIGDATGHGAPAALLTSAARAVASVITYGPPRSVSDSLAILNRAICETSKGKMMMTFFLACIDKETGEMSYSNASHEPPLLLHATQDIASREDFLPLNEVNNPRLGEQIDCIFKEATVQLQAGDRIIFYTDGVVDVKNPEAKSFGERRFLKSLATEFVQNETVFQALDAVVHNLHEFRSQTALDDDVTLILTTYRSAS